MKKQKGSEILPRPAPPTPENIKEDIQKASDDDPVFTLAHKLFGGSFALDVILYIWTKYINKAQHRIITWDLIRFIFLADEDARNQKDGSEEQMDSDANCGAIEHQYVKVSDMILIIYSQKNMPHIFKMIL